MKTVTTVVTIGKSKREIAYTFKAEDFIRIEGHELFLKSDDRKLIIAPDMVSHTINELNK